MEGEREGRNAGDERSLRTRKQRKKPGSLPLVLFVSLESSDSRPDCIHASNPFHKCTHQCSQRIPRGLRREKSAPIATTAKAEDGEGSKKIAEKDVRCECRYASNPFHNCAEYCHNSKISKIDGENRVGRAKERRDDGQTTAARNVHPMCLYAPNPFHTCVASCYERFGEKDKEGLVAVKEGEENIRIAAKLNLQQKCKYASNPFHNCADYCLQGVPGKDRVNIRKTEKYREENNKVDQKAEKNTDHSQCVHESSPCDTSADCFEKANGENQIKEAKPEQSSDDLKITEECIGCDEKNPEIHQAPKEGKLQILPSSLILVEAFVFVLLYVIHLIVISGRTRSKKNI